MRLSIEVRQVCLCSQQYSVTTLGGKIELQIIMDGICCQCPKMVEVERHTWLSELQDSRPRLLCTYCVAYLLTRCGSPIWQTVWKWSVHVSYVTSNAPTFSFDV